MPDVVVTVPMNFTYDPAPGLKGLAAWAAEGDKPGDPWSGKEWDFTTWGHQPDIAPGERVYVVCERQLRGYAPLVRLEMGPRRGPRGDRSLSFIRSGGAVAVTVPQEIIGFRGWKYRWWGVEDERPFSNWLEDSIATPALVAPCESERHRRAAPAAAWCATYRAPADDAVLAHHHLCTVHANSEKRFGHVTIVPIASCHDADSFATHCG